MRSGVHNPLEDEVEVDKRVVPQVDTADSSGSGVVADSYKSDSGHEEIDFEFVAVVDGRLVGRSWVGTQTQEEEHRKEVDWQEDSSQSVESKDVAYAEIAETYVAQMLVAWLDLVEMSFRKVADQREIVVEPSYRRTIQPSRPW